MKRVRLQGAKDVQHMRDLINRLPYPTTVVDFEEYMQLPAVRNSTCLWEEDHQTSGFAFVDDFNNLYFEIAPEYRSAWLEEDIIAWATEYQKKRNIQTDQKAGLDACFSSQHVWQIALLERSGFVQDRLRTLRFARSLAEPISAIPLPPGFSLRCVSGVGEVEDLVNLHRTAFGTQNMTVERRLAIMNAPTYERELDLLAVAPDGKLAAFCICGMDQENAQLGFTDPIGVHPRCQRRGLGKAVVNAGLRLLRERGVTTAELGTSSENIAMRRLAESVGFRLASEKLWFSKKIE